MNEPWRNAEHYMDLTAYLAIKNMERAKDMLLPKKGEIWEADYNGVCRNVVVIATHERYCSVLMLQSEKVNDKQVEVIAKSIMYAEPAMISYAFYNRFISLVKSMPDNDFSDLLGCVADALCIQMDEQTDKADELEKELAVCKEENKALRKNLLTMQSLSNGSNDIDVAKLQAERDVYKTLYTEALAKLIDGR